MNFPRILCLTGRWQFIKVKFIDAIFFEKTETAMERKPRISGILLMVLLFEFACAYNVFNTVAEADFLSGKKYEARDIEEVYAEKQSNPDLGLISPALCTFLPGIILEFFPSFPPPNILSIQTFSVLRC